MSMYILVISKEHIAVFAHISGSCGSVSTSQSL